MVVGQDLGITLDYEGWCVKAAAKGIEQTTDVIVTAVADADGRAHVDLTRHTTGEALGREVDWVVCCVAPRPVDALFQELSAAGVPVVRVGDAVAPRRAHAAVIDGDRAGSSLSAPVRAFA
ncbi:MAG: mycofactocin system FadH/OYE family oxidoreductase 2, partial [Mycobacteriales bacterium]